MNGPAHYREAERLLNLSAELPPNAAKDIGAITVAQAQVHATLAHAAATIDAGNVVVQTSNIDGASHEVENSYEWSEAIR